MVKDRRCKDLVATLMKLAIAATAVGPVGGNSRPSAQQWSWNCSRELQ